MEDNVDPRDIITELVETLAREARNHGKDLVRYEELQRKTEDEREKISVLEKRVAYLEAGLRAEAEESEKIDEAAREVAVLAEKALALKLQVVETHVPPEYVTKCQHCGHTLMIRHEKASLTDSVDNAPTHCDGCLGRLKDAIDALAGLIAPF